MGFSSGVWTPPSLPGSWSPALSGQAATPSDWNTLLAAIATGLSTTICRDGQSTITADIPFAGFRLKNVGNGILVTDAANVGQLQSGAGVYAVDTGTADHYAIAPTPAISAYAVGQAFRFEVTHANATTTPGLAVNGLTEGTISYSDGSALAMGDMAANALVNVYRAQRPRRPFICRLARPLLRERHQRKASNNTTLATNAYADRVGVQQVVATQIGAVATGTTVIPLDDTIPQITEGDEYMTAAITPMSATSKLLIEVVFNFAINNANVVSMALFQDATANALRAVGDAPPNISGTTNFPGQMMLRHEMTSGTTSATTFRVRAGTSSGGGTVTFNGASAARLYGGVMASSITITEIGV